MDELIIRSVRDKCQQVFEEERKKVGQQVGIQMSRWRFVVGCNTRANQSIITINIVKFARES